MDGLQYNVMCLWVTLISQPFTRVENALQKWEGAKASKTRANSHLGEGGGHAPPGISDSQKVFIRPSDFIKA